MPYLCAKPIRLAGLYIHIPFCKQKCHYCDFHFAVSLRNKRALLDALKKEIILRKGELDETLTTVYFGGGTPSVLTASELSDIFQIIHANYPISKTAEITLEANPDDLSESFLQELKVLGVNRLSIGVQSFFDEDLQFMNRVHTAKEALFTIRAAQNTDIKNISIDLIYGIPGLSLEKWQENLEKFKELNIPHLSSYALTVEPKTALAHFIATKKIAPLDDDLAKHHFDKLIRFMSENSFQHYEVSNFAKEDFLSKHNTSYWQGKSYIGIGPSAHSYQKKNRSWNVANNTKYIRVLKSNKLPSEIENLSDSMRFNEYLMTGLRTIWGVDLNKIRQEFGLEFHDYLLKTSQKHVQNRHLQISSDAKLTVNPKSLFLIDGIIADLFWVD